MNEDDISRELYQAATASDGVEVLSWQAVSGKAYLTRDMRFRIGRETQATDLVLYWAATLWLIEVKGSHVESLLQDEPKLRRLLAAMSHQELLDQVARRCKRRLPGETVIRPVVAYSEGEKATACADEIGHVPWEAHRPNLLTALSRA